MLVAVLVTAALAVLYRIAPDRDAPKMRWVSVGAALATVLWLLASIGFSIYVSTFGNYAKTYGVFAGIIVLLFWLWITSYAILLGAEINAEAEQQTAADTTKVQPNHSANATPSKPTPPPATTHHRHADGTTARPNPAPSTGESMQIDKQQIIAKLTELGQHDKAPRPTAAARPGRHRPTRRPARQPGHQHLRPPRRHRRQHRRQARPLSPP